MGAQQSSPSQPLNYPPANVSQGQSFGSGACIEYFEHTYDTLPASATLGGPYGHLTYDSNWNVGTPYASAPSINWTSPINYARASAARAKQSGHLPNITVDGGDSSPIPIYTHFMYACAEAGPTGYGTQKAVPCNISINAISVYQGSSQNAASASLTYTPIYNATSGRALMADSLAQSAYYNDLFQYDTKWTILTFNATNAQTGVPVDLHIDDFNYALGYGGLGLRPCPGFLDGSP